MKIQIAELRELEKKATPGPWQHGGTGTIVSMTGDSVAGTDSEVTAPDGDWFTDGDADAKFIAAARNALPQLLDTLDAALAVVEAARKFKRPFDRGFPNSLDAILARDEIFEALAAFDERSNRER